MQMKLAADTDLFLIIKQVPVGMQTSPNLYL